MKRNNSEEIFKTKIFWIALFISVIIVYTVNFFKDDLREEIYIPSYDYTMELTYSDGSKRVLTDHAYSEVIQNKEPVIESPIFHEGYYTTIDNKEYYGIVALRCISKTPSRYKIKSYRSFGMTRYDSYKQGCPLIDSMFRGSEYLGNKKWENH